MVMLIMVLLAIGTIAGLAIYRGFVLSILWGWFIVPLGAVDIGIAGAIGISLIWGMFNFNTSKEKEGGEAIAMVIVGPLLALLMGWITVQFM